MEPVQHVDQVIDISSWPRHEEVYPEGAREKNLVYCPSPAPYSFLNENHGYLFKRSSPRYPEQYWMEIFAYHLGKQMHIEVPRALVAYDGKHNGALIRWYLETGERHISGGDYCQQYLPGFERKKGLAHNFTLVSQIFHEKSQGLDWKTYWAEIFVFDALIGNTDRHQENWVIIEIPSVQVRFAPVFDNGTSMGHEIFPEAFEEKERELEKYVLKGRHHMKWESNDTKRMEHSAFLKKFIDRYPETQKKMINCLKRVDNTFFKELLDYLSQFNVKVNLSSERATFMLKLLNFRHQRLIAELEK
jgi:hypothetical protein